ncbi:MAG: hypothetical protein ABSE46_03840 [Terracidiphilus sp.]|jgi:hypothetical protein
MHAANEQLQDGVLFVEVLQLFGIIFLDYARQKCRIASILGKSGGFVGVWPRGVSDLALAVFWFMWMPASFLRDVVFHQGAHSRAPLSLSTEVSLAAMDTVLFLFLAFAFLSKLRMRGLGDFRVSRGKLYASVSKLSKRAKYLGFESTPLYVVPDADFARIFARIPNGVILPRGLLDMLTRSEIDALAARQLCVQSRQSYIRGFWVLLACNVTVVSAAQWIRVSPPYSFLIYLPWLAAEFIAINSCLPHLLFLADIRSIQLTGDRESFFSVLGGMSRFTGVPLQEPIIQTMGQKTGVSPDRIPALLGVHEAKPEDRYPTSGSYMETGL